MEILIGSYYNSNFLWNSCLYIIWGWCLECNILKYNLKLLEFQQLEIILITIVIILGIDLLIEFCTAYYEQGNIIMDSKKIALNYYYNYLLFDLIAYVTFTIRCLSFTN